VNFVVPTQTLLKRVKAHCSLSDILLIGNGHTRVFVVDGEVAEDAEDEPTNSFAANGQSARESFDTADIVGDVRQSGSQKLLGQSMAKYNPHLVGLWSLPRVSVVVLALGIYGFEQPQQISH
jgi:hypothetical protein